MTAEVLHFSDYHHPRSFGMVPQDNEGRAPTAIIVLPIIRIERARQPESSAAEPPPP